MAMLFVNGNFSGIYYIPEMIKIMKAISFEHAGVHYYYKKIEFIFN
ncbi:MAG: hypothetical protein WC549_01915 [Actinomycetota bacterium]